MDGPAYLDTLVVATWQCSDCKRKFGAIISKRVRVPNECPYCAGVQPLEQLDLFGEVEP